MSEPENDSGVMAMLAKRLVEQRLPRALELEKKVGRGEVLDDFDFAFLEEVFKDASTIKPMVAKDPQYVEVAARMVHLYKEIIAKALENEKAQQRP